MMNYNSVYSMQIASLIWLFWFLEEKKDWCILVWSDATSDGRSLALAEFCGALPSPPDGKRIRYQRGVTWISPVEIVDSSYHHNKAQVVMDISRLLLQIKSHQAGMSISVLTDVEFHSQAEILRGYSQCAGAIFNLDQKFWSQNYLF